MYIYILYIEKINFRDVDFFLHALHLKITLHLSSEYAL